MTENEKTREPMTWTSKNVHRLRRLGPEDKIIFGDAPDLTYTMKVCNKFLVNNPHCNFVAVYDMLGLGDNRSEFVSQVCGVPTTGGWSPTIGGDHFSGFVPLVKLILIGGKPLARAIARVTGKKPPTKRELAAQAKAAKVAAELKAEAKMKAEAARKKALAGLTDRARAVVEFFRVNRGAFGCQRDHARQLCCALTGENITADMLVSP